MGASSPKVVEIIGMHWVIRWAGSYTFISCDYWGKQYFFSLNRELGSGFSHSLFIHRRGVVSFYLVREEYKSFGESMAEISIQDPARAHNWLTHLKNNTDKINSIMEKLTGRAPSLREYHEFLSSFSLHLPLHNFMKKTVDFLPQKDGEKLIPQFKDARLYSENVYSNTEAYFRQLARVIAQKSSYLPENLTCLTQDELELYLQTEQLPSEASLKDRYECSVLYFVDGRPTLILGSDQIKLVEEAIAGGHVEDINYIHGTVAYPGKVIGMVRVVLDPHHPGEFNNGDVLVTGMTRPEFSLLVNQSAAIVTDAGGVLCHAAITARELQKPCIVGTEVATKVLKDGDMIEVDANAGKVKMIKRANE